jgi:hypothetical protein
MPAVLLAGIVASVKCTPFPQNGRPCCTLELRVAESAVPWRIETHDDLMNEAETLVPGDAIAIQGQLNITARPGPDAQRIIGICVTATQLMPLRRRSPNRLPIMREQEETRRL